MAGSLRSCPLQTPYVAVAKIGQRKGHHRCILDGVGALPVGVDGPGRGAREIAALWCRWDRADVCVQRNTRAKDGQDEVETGEGHLYLTSLPDRYGASQWRRRTRVRCARGLGRGGRSKRRDTV